jgi:ketosteroid isomerase-like protein
VGGFGGIVLSQCGAACVQLIRGDTNTSVKELQALTQKFADAFDQRDLQPILDMLSEDVEVFDRVPYRFDGKALVAKYLNEVIASLASASFGFRQPSCRMYSDEVGIVNAHDMFTGVTKDGKTVSIHGRTTLVFIKQGGQSKIVSAHFSAIPKAL